MKVHVLSDLHLEHMDGGSRTNFFAKLEAAVARDKPDIAVIAGDMYSLDPHYLQRFKNYATIFADIYPMVVYVPGNHEFWGTTIREGLEEIRKMETDRFIPLFPGEPREILGKKWAGGTLWYPDPGEGFRDRKGYISFIDFDRINDGDPAIFVEHQKFLSSRFEDADIVVSHHFPTAESIAPMWAGSSYNVFFSSFSEDRLAQGAPKGLWVHGHTHNPFDYMSKFGFRVYCNAHGYPKEGMNPDFWDRLLVEIDNTPTP